MYHEPRLDVKHEITYHVSMQATTIKLEYPILKELRKFLPPHQSLTAFVREILERDLRRRKIIQAADAYVAWLAKHPEEQEWMDEWSGADLEHMPTPTGRKKRR